MRRRLAPMSVVAPILITLIVLSSLIIAFASPSHAVRTQAQPPQFKRKMTYLPLPGGMAISVIATITTTLVVTPSTSLLTRYPSMECPPAIEGW